MDCLIKINASKKELSILLFLFYSFVAIAQSGTIKITKTEYDCYVNNEKGMKIHSYVNVIGWKDKPVQYVVFFYKGSMGSGGKLYSTGGYTATDGQVCAHSNSKSDYDNCEWKDWCVFIPYSALPHTAGKNDYSLLATIRKKEDKWIEFAATPYWNFNVTYNNPSTSNVTSSVSDNTKSSAEQVQHTHYCNGGIDIDYYYYSDIKMTRVVTKSSCYSCAGTGVCSFCHGQRGIWMSFGYVPCTLCGGTGICKQCNATGVIETQYWLDGISGVFSATNNNGTSYSGVVDLYSSSSNSTSSTSSASSKSINDYYEIKEYAPDYTGKQNKVWCEKCRSYDYPHTHVKKHY